MKLPFWNDPNDEVQIIDNTEEAKDKYGRNYGSDTIKLSNKHIEALKAGKMLAWDDSEYSTFVILENKDNE